MIEVSRGDKFYCIKDGYDGAFRGCWYYVGAIYTIKGTEKLSSFALEDKKYVRFRDEYEFRVMISAHTKSLRKFRKHFIRAEKYKQWKRDKKIKDVLNEGE